VASGPLLRQSEAASDLVRILLILRDPGRVLHEVDGGVGDDKAEMTAKSSVSLVQEVPIELPWAVGSSGCLPGAGPSPSTPGPADVTPRWHRPPWPPGGAGPRQAWLQLFRF
jgi:hypothetical protein